MSAAELLNEVGKLASFLSLFERAKKVLETAAQYEGQEASLQQQVKAAQLAVVDAVGVRDNANAEADAAIARRDAVAAEIKQSLDAASTANAEAVRTARSEVDAARKEAESIQATAAAAVKALAAQSDALRAEIETETKRLAELQAQVLALRQDARQRFA